MSQSARTFPTASITGAFLRRDLQVALSYRLPFLFDALGAAFSVATFALVGKIVPTAGIPGGYISFVLAGLTLTVFLQAATGMVGTTVRTEQMQGTLEAMIATGVPARAIGAGYAAYPLVWATAVAIVTVVVGVIAGARAPGANWSLALVALVLGLCAFSGIGFAGAGAVLVFGRGGGLIGWFVALLTLVGGELFPPEVLPDWVLALSQLSPFTLCLEILRAALLEQASWSAYAGKVVVLAAMAVVCVVGGVAALSWSLRRAQRSGSLSGY